jgi:hypothetical protein
MPLLADRLEGVRSAGALITQRYAEVRKGVDLKACSLDGGFWSLRVRRQG